MSNIDRSVVNFETLGADAQTEGSTSKSGSPKRAGFGKKNNGPALNVKKGGSGPSKKVSKPTKTSGKFGSSKEGHAQGKGANGKIR